MKGVALLGSTGSIGCSTLDVISKFPDKFTVVSLAAGRNIERLAQQISVFHPQLVSVAQEDDVQRLRDLLGANAPIPEILHGERGVDAVAQEDDASIVVTAMVGAAGLKPTLTAIRRGITVAIANKEPLVIAGQLCTAEAKRCGATLLPVDSEHSAIFQCLSGAKPTAVRKLLLTCSGGPFRQTQDLSNVTLAQALQHPTWSMGDKITIDSATLVNKGLEIIEAHWLFGLPADQIEVVIHPQSVIHSMVEFVDGSVMAQLGLPDMRTPIAFALAYPDRLPLPQPSLDWKDLGDLTFESPDTERFDALSLAYRALEACGTAPAVLNAANEIAVAAFLEKEITYLDICETIERTLDAHQIGDAQNLDEILAADQWARQHAQNIITGLKA